MPPSFAKTPDAILPHTLSLADYRLTMEVGSKMWLVLVDRTSIARLGLGLDSQGVVLWYSALAILFFRQEVNH
jgi:hypothetical protein